MTEHLTTSSIATPIAQLRAELTAKPARARRRIVHALAEARGNATRAAVLLGISLRSMTRLLADPEIASERDRIVEARRAARR